MPVSAESAGGPGRPALQIVDALAGGDTSRVIIGGAPALNGATVREQCADFARRFDYLRLKLMQPPHGALHMCPVLLLPPATPDTDFGVIIMESMGYPPISGSNLFCAAAVALERGFAAMREPETRLRVETPAGIIAMTAYCRSGRCNRVELENSPARIKSSLAARTPSAPAGIPVTVISAGVDYAVVDAGRLGITLSPEAGDRLLGIGAALADAANTDFTLFHERVHTGNRGAACTVAVYQSPGVICRSPTGTGTSAMLVMAHSRGMIAPDVPLTTTSPAGNCFVGRILAVEGAGRGAVLRTMIGGDVESGPELRIP